MTDTDLITVGDSPIQAELPVTAPAKTSGTASRSGAGADAEATVATGSLTTMVLPELRALAGRVGVRGTSGMRKSELIAAIRESQKSSGGGSRSGGNAGESKDRQQKSGDNAGNSAAEADSAAQNTQSNAAQDNAAQDNASQSGETAKAPVNEAPSNESRRDNAGGQEPRRRERRAATREAGASPTQEAEPTNAEQPNSGANSGDNNSRDGGPREGGAREGRDAGRPAQESRESADQSGDSAGNQGSRDDDGDGRQGRRGRRFRDRRRRGDRPGGEGSGSGGGESELREDDVVQPVAGILDVLDNYAFVRTSGYLAGPNDVYVSMNMVRKNGLRRGDAVTGAVRVAKEGDQANQRQKFNPLVRLDSVNGGPVEDARKRPEFGKLTPLYPNQRLRLETTPERLTTRVIDLIMPIGKGQRALIVSPPKAGKTTILQDIANAITRNNPECHLMVVLVDERPEEVTDMTRSVKGEVIASTFDRPPSDHTSVAELAIERAKRLVEQGKDVVVLLDSITRLGRAYNNASPASGRILSGGVDSTALYPPKRFLGAARNIEHGGSLTIIATAMVETGSTGDTVIFEEFKGTGNAELKLDRKIAERRVFPAVDVNPSGTRKDELLLSADEFAIVHKLRRVLSGLDSHQAIDLLMSQLRKTKTNYEFLVQVSKTAPGAMDSD